jgi:hypothetical protein
MTAQPSHPSSGPAPRPLTSTRPKAPYANCGRATGRHQSRRHTGYVTALGRDCRGCLRTTPTDRAGTSWSAPSPARASTSRSAPPQAPRGTQRDEPAQVGRVPPQTTPLLSVWGCKWGSNPLSSTTLHTPHTSGRGRKFNWATHGRIGPLKVWRNPWSCLAFVRPPQSCEVVPFHVF